MYQISTSRDTHEYKTENGLTAVIERAVSRGYSRPLFYTGYVVDAQGCKIPTSWTTDGIAVGFSPETSKHDIVRIVAKTMQVDWSKYPDWVKSVALAVTGSLVCCPSEMQLTITGWSAKKEKGPFNFLWFVYPNQYPDLIPEFDGDWKDSYVERPAPKVSGVYEMSDF